MSSIQSTLQESITKLQGSLAELDRLIAKEEAFQRTQVRGAGPPTERETLLAELKETRAQGGRHLETLTRELEIVAAREDGEEEEVPLLVEDTTYFL